MRVRRLIGWAGLVAAVLAIAGLVVLRLPAVQRRLVLRLFPEQSGLSLQMDRLDAGLRRVRADQVRFRYQGLEVRVEHADFQYRLRDLVSSRTARIEGLTVRGLTVDLREAQRTESKSPPPPFRFEGLRPFARLPVKVILRKLSVGAEVLLPAAGGATLRLKTNLTGDHLAPGTTGRLDAAVGLRLEGKEKAEEVLSGRGTLRLHEDAEGLLDLAEFEGEVRPGRPAPRGERGLAARVKLDLTAEEERYQAAFSTLSGPSREVLAVDALAAAGGRRVRGTWTAGLDRGQVDPYLGAFIPPEFSLSGEGRFDADLDARTLALESRFDLAAQRWERLHPALASVGPLRFQGTADATLSRERIEVRTVKLSAADPSGRTLLQATGGQPFAVDLAARRLVPSAWGRPVLRARLDRLPLAWVRTGGGAAPIRDGTLSGALDLTWDSPERIRLAAVEPLAVDRLLLRRADGTEFGPLTARASPRFTVDPARVEAALQGLRATLPTGAVLDFQGAMALPRDGRQQAELQGELALRLPRIFQAVKGLESLSARGSFGLDLQSRLLAVRAVDFAARGTGGEHLMDGHLTTVSPLEVDLERLTVAWDRFQPETLVWKIDGFPIDWVSRFLPQIRLTSGRVYGEFGVKRQGEEVRIEGSRPFEIRDADLFLGDVSLARDIRLQVQPSFVLTRGEVLTTLKGIRVRGGGGTRLDGEVILRAVPSRGGRLAVTASLKGAVPRLTDPVGRLGEFSLELEGGLDPARRIVNIGRAAFDCRDTDNRSYLSGTSLQPFRITLDPLEVSAEGKSPDLFRASFIPLELERLFPSAAGFELSGPLPRGSAIISAAEGGFLFHAPEPLAFGPVSVSRNGVPLLKGVEFDLTPEVLYTRLGFRSRAGRLDISARGRRIARLEGQAVFDVAGLDRQQSGNLRVELDLAGLSGQPVGAGLPAFRSGKVAAQLEAARGPRPSFDFSLDLRGAVRPDGAPLPDLAGKLRLRQEPDGRVSVESPWRWGAGSRISDLRVRGRLGREAGERSADLAVDSERLVVDDLLAIGRAFLPPRADGARAAKPAPGRSGSEGAAAGRHDPAIRRLIGVPDDRPFWHGLRGTVPIELRRVEIDRFVIESARGSLNVSPDRFALEGLGAGLLGARLEGAATIGFRSSRERPYSLDAALAVKSLDLKRVFETGDPARPPILEGMFEVAVSGVSEGATVVDLLLRSRDEIRVDGKDGTFRALAEPPQRLSRLTRMAGALTFSKEMRAVGRLMLRLSDLRFSRAAFHLTRDPESGMVLRTLSLDCDNVRVTGSGQIPAAPEVPFLDHPLSASLGIAARGDPAVVFDGVGLLEKAPDAAGFRPVNRPIRLAGTLGAPDASDLRRTLDEAAANARGSFGVALRKVLEWLESP